MDQSLAVESINGVCPNQVNLINITGAQRAVGDTSGLGTRTVTRITVGGMFGGYLSYAAGDGYLNPPTINKYSKTSVLAAQLLTEMEWILGPITYPYSLNGFTGGTDSNLFFPISNSNVSIYVQILGPALNPVNGMFFKVQGVMLGASDNISYYLRLDAVDEVV